jgi:hypothetical protein
MSASCASKRLSARNGDTQTPPRARCARALLDPRRSTGVRCLPAGPPPMRARRQWRRLGRREAAARTLRLSHLSDTAIQSLQSVRRQEIAAVRPGCWNRHADHARPSLDDANDCALVAGRRPSGHRTRLRRIPRTIPPYREALHTFHAHGGSAEAARTSPRRRQQRCRAAQPDLTISAEGTSAEPVARTRHIAGPSARSRRGRRDHRASCHGRAAAAPGRRPLATASSAIASVSA